MFTIETSCCSLGNPSADMSDTQNTSNEGTENIYNRQSWHRKRQCSSAKRSLTPACKAHSKCLDRRLTWHRRQFMDYRKVMINDNKEQTFIHFQTTITLQHRGSPQLEKVNTPTFSKFELSYHVQILYLVYCSPFKLSFVVISRPLPFPYYHISITIFGLLFFINYCNSKNCHTFAL